MFERGGVEDDLRPESLEHLADAVRVPDIGQRRLIGVEESTAVQCELNGVQRGLVVVQHDQFRWVEPVQLPAQLGADGPASAGDQDPLARELVGDRRHVGLNGTAAEQVADPGVPDALNVRPAGQQLTHRRDDLGHQPAALGGGGQVTDHRAARPGNGDHEHGRAGLGRRRRHPGAIAEDGDTADPQPSLRRVVVQHRHWPVFGARLAGQPVSKLAARTASPEDNDLDGRPGGGPGALPDSERHIPRAEHGGHGEERAACHRFEWCPLAGHEPGSRRDQGQAGGARRHAHASDFVEASPLVAASVQPSEEPAGEGHQASGQRRSPERRRQDADIRCVVNEHGGSQQAAQPGGSIAASLHSYPPPPPCYEGTLCW